jgi:3-hydroxyisobutyrate dehydrogenase
VASKDEETHGSCDWIVRSGKHGLPDGREHRRHGLPLMIYNRKRSKAEALASESGAHVGVSPAEVGGSCEVILTMVSDAKALKDLYLEPSGIVQGLRLGITCVEVSTVGPSSIRRFDHSLRTLGVRLLDAPVSGSVALARDAQLTMMIAGAVSDLERVRPILYTTASRLFHVGSSAPGLPSRWPVGKHL